MKFKTAAAAASAKDTVKGMSTMTIAWGSWSNTAVICSMNEPPVGAPTPITAAIFATSALSAVFFAADKAGS